MRASGFLTVGILLVAASIGFGRTWTDKKGKEFEADLVEVKGGIAHLKREDDGKIVKVAVAKLSADDQEYIKTADKGGDPPAASGKKAGKKSAAGKAATSSSASSISIEGINLELVGLAINKPVAAEAPAADGPPPGGLMPMMGSPGGVSFSFAVTAPKRSLVGLDKDDSKISTCADDTGHDLAKAQAGGGLSPLMAMGSGPINLRLDPGGHRGVIEISQPQAPAAGAIKIHLQGELVVRVGEGEKSAEQKNIPLDALSEITVGPVPFKLEPSGGGGQGSFGLLPSGGTADVPTPAADGDSPVGAAQGLLKGFLGGVASGGGGGPQVMVNISSSKPLDTIKKLVFVDADGKEIAQQEFGSGEFGGGGQMTYTRTLSLQTSAPKVTLRVVSFEKIGAVTLPFNVETGVGF